MNINASIHTIFLLSLLLIIQSCGGGEDDASGNSRFGDQRNNRADRGTSVETVTVETKSISQQIRSYGTIRAKDLINITPLVSERITEIYVDIGDTVRQGQKLAQIYQKPFYEQVQQARSTLQQNISALERDSAEFRRQEQLFERQLVSATAFDQARATYLSSKNQVESARSALQESIDNLSNTVIRSPVLGVITNRPLSEGDVASTGTTMFEIANTVGYETRVFLPLEDWKLAKVGQEVTLRASNQSGIAGRGRVSRINPRLDPTTGLGEVVIALTERGPSIYQGVLVETAINVQTHENAVVIPRSALVENIETVIEPESNSIQLERTYSAFIVKDDTLAVKKDLTLGIEQGDQIEVIEGINASDELIITGQSGLADQSKVRVAGQPQFTESPDKQINQNVSDSATVQQSGAVEGDNNAGNGEGTANSNNSN